MKRILTVLILLLITGVNAQTYTHNSKVRVKTTDTAADTDNLVTIDANGLLKRTTQTVDQVLIASPTLDNVLTAGNTTTQIPIFNGGFNSVFGVISNTLDFSRLSNSLFTIRESSIGTGTTVNQFIDVTRENTSEATTAQTFGLVSRVVNTSDETNQGLIGANLVGRDNGEGDLEFVYGSITQADAQNQGSIDFLVAESLRTNITGSGAYTIDFARGLSTDLVLDNPSANVTFLQAMHPSIQLTNGTVTDVTNLYLDLDWDNTGSTTVIGDIAYVRAGNDPLPTPTGNTYFIKSEVTHPSEFAGSIEATSFIGNGSSVTNVDAVTVDGKDINDYVPYTGATQNINLNTRDLTTTGNLAATNYTGNFDGQNSTYYDFRVYGIGNGVENNAAYTGDVLLISDTGFRRVASTATNLPIAQNGFIRSVYRSSSFRTYEFIADNGRLFNYAGGAWIEYLPLTGGTLTGSLTATSFVKTGATSDDVLLGDGTTTSLSGIPSLPSGFYEDVTSFSPTLVDNGGGATYSATTTNGTYYRIGNIVHFTASFVTISTTGTPTGQLRINNLPYNPSGSIENIEINNFRGSDVSSTDIGLMVGRVATGYAYFYNKTDASSADSVTFTSGVLTISGSYSVSQYTP